MRRWLAIGALLLVAYAATGMYVVAGNEAAVIRRCGRVVTTDSGDVRLVPGGLHFDLPWPLATVDRVNLNESRTLTIGQADVVEGEVRDFLESYGPDRRGQFLTGDKNLLDLQIVVTYRASAADVRDYLYASQTPDERLRTLVEAVAADFVSRSGVDFVHPLGLGRLRELLTDRVRELATTQRLGVEIEEVAVTAVNPPIRVKAYFLDVSNARADKENAIQSALAYRLQRQEATRGETRRIRDAAATERDSAIQQARAEAESFARLVAECRREAESGTHDYAAARRMTLERRYVETLTTVLSRVAKKVVLDAGQPVDLTIQRSPQE